MTDPEPPRPGDGTPDDPDGHRGREDAQLSHGARLTGTVAGLLAEQIRQTADLRELRPRERLAAALRQLAGAVERTKSH